MGTAADKQVLLKFESAIVPYPTQSAPCESLDMRCGAPYCLIYVTLHQGGFCVRELGAFSVLALAVLRWQ